MAEFQNRMAKKTPSAAGASLADFESDPVQQPPAAKRLKPGDMQPDSGQGAQAQGKAGKGKKKKTKRGPPDPSSQFLNKPTGTPLVREAVKFFNSRWPKAIPPQFTKHLADKKFKVICNKVTGWRTTAKLSVRGSNGGKKDPVIGLFAPNSHTVVRIPDSPAHHPAINRAVAVLEDTVKEVGLEGYDGVTPGGLSYVAFTVQRGTGTVQLTLVWNAADREAVGEALVERVVASLLAAEEAAVLGGGGGKGKGKGQGQGKEKAAGGGGSSSGGGGGDGGGGGKLWHSIWLHFHPCDRHDNSIFGRRDNSWVCAHGTDSGVAENLRSLRLERPPNMYYPPFVFRQANITAFEGGQGR
jgi:hypothetical protein